MSDFIVAFGIPLAYIALAIAAIAAIVFPVMFMFQDLKKAKWAFIGIGAMAVIFLICYALSSGEASERISEGQSRIVEASLFTFYIMLFVAIASVLYSTVSSYFK